MKGFDPMKLDKDKLTGENGHRPLGEDKGGEEEKTLYENGEDIKTQKWKEDSLDLRATKFVSSFFFFFILLFYDVYVVL